MAADGGSIDPLEVLNRVCQTVAGELDLHRAVQTVTNAAVELSRAQFGAFFYNAINDEGELYQLYTLAGAPREAFANYPMPRNTQLFGQTFEGRGIVRLDDVSKDPRYGKMGPHYGMPKGHLPVRSYLAVPVVSRAGEVLGGLFMGHGEVGVFDAQAERLISMLASQAAIAIDGARLYEKSLRAEARLREMNAGLAARARDEQVLTSTAKQELVRLEVGARETAELFRLVINSVVDYAIYMLNVEGRVATWNAGAERIKGYSDEEILGSHFSRFYTPEDVARGEPARALGAAREAGRFEGQGWRVRKDGTRFWASVIIDTVRDESGQLIGFAKVTRDITEQRHAAITLERTREALFQAQKMETIGQLSGGIAHDFNNMLAGILGSLSVLRERLQKGEVDQSARYLDVAIESAKRAASLTSRLLAFGRRQSLDIKSINVHATLDSMWDLLRRTMGENIRIKLDLGAANAAARTDSNQLESALLNLAINARDAMPDGGDLTISTERVEVGEDDEELAPGEYVVLSVKDSGVGMTPDVAAKAFDPFFTTKPIGIGTGLGLSMVFGFVNQTGGRVRLETKPNHGTAIKLYLPGADVAERVESKPVPETTPAPASGKTVLVVEDEALVRMLIVDVLGDLGYNVIEARDANEAMPALTSKQHIDLLLTDVGLPGLNGRQLAEVARQHRPDLRVLFLTGYAEHAMQRSDFLGAGMEMMTKPFEVEQLGAKVSSIVQGA
jgi:PAS domain S-box-containing protein